jgi:hypothetical protein
VIQLLSLLTPLRTISAQNIKTLLEIVPPVHDVETYIAHLKANDDFINIAFYKSSIFGSNANKLNQTIAWHNVAGQFVDLENIKDQTPFISKTVGGITYNRVTSAIPTSDVKYSWTKWNYAYYDQKSGFIELIDTGGVSWLRQ